jgi:diguanylate cyclase (GGDEF)-like protein
VEVGSTGGAGALTVLLVEDSRTDAALMESMLRQASAPAFEVSRVETLAAALEWLGRRAPDVVLLDLTLPDSEGLETYRSVRNRRPDVPVVVVTGVQESGLGEAAVQEGAQDFLAKGSVTGGRLTETVLFAVARARQGHARLRDPLTGLATAALLEERVTEALQRVERDKRYVAVLAIGFGGFAGLDGRFGPRAADGLLYAVAERLCSVFPPPAAVGRVAVDEFAAVLEGLARPSNAERAGQRVLGALTAEFKVGDATVLLAPSVGIALGRTAGDAPALLIRARTAMAGQRRTGDQGVRLA